MRPDLEGLKKRALAELATVATQQALEQWRADYLGRRDGAVTAVLRSLAKLPSEERRAVGAAANALKTELEQAHAEREQALAQQSLAQAVEKGKLDVTLPGRPVALGRYHPVTRILREVLGAFATLGFEVVEGPEVEWDYYNFEALNIPPGHPARDMWNTLWVDTASLPQGQGGPSTNAGPASPRASGSPLSTDVERGRGEASGQQVLLRTHTSPMQVRIMEQRQPPVRVVVPGKVYRYEATDATHEWMFTQVEGLAVDEGITFIDLKATLYEFARQLFGAERKVRFRCDYFPFVEPGCEMAIDCFACNGSGRGKNGSTSSPRGGAVCGTCRGDGWIEILGAGMVHPHVLERVGYDSRRYTGFAFGMGAERIAMLKHGIDDIRLFYSNDLRFLRQF